MPCGLNFEGKAKTGSGHINSTIDYHLQWRNICQNPCPKLADHYTRKLLPGYEEKAKRRLKGAEVIFTRS